MSPTDVTEALVARNLIPADHTELRALLAATAARVCAAPPEGDLLDAVADAFQGDVWDTFAAQDPAPDAIEFAICHFANHPYGAPVRLKLVDL